MTLYQRIYASKSVKQAKKAWYIAGLFEWPVMAFMGVMLGLFARVAFDNGMFAEVGYPTGSPLDAEMGLPLLLRVILPFGLMGLMLSAFFSAILSTADSCLIAASGNILTDIIQKIKPGKLSDKKLLTYSKVLTLIIGIVAVGIAMEMEGVLELMLYSYAIMVSGLLVPVIALLAFKKPDKTAALASMITGGLTTLVLTILEIELPFGLAPNIFGLTISVLSYIIIHYTNQFKYQKNEI